MLQTRLATETLTLESEKYATAPLLDARDQRCTCHLLRNRRQREAPNTYWTTWRIDGKNDPRVCRVGMSCFDWGGSHSGGDLLLR